MGLLKTEAIVLRSNIIGETDKIAILLTKDYGKLQAVAKGARRSKSRLINSTRPFSIGNYVLFEGKNYYYIDQWELINLYQNFEKDLMKLSYAAYFTNVLDKVLEYNEKNLSIFNLLKSALNNLDNLYIDENILYISYNLKLLLVLGYFPEMNNCTVCGIQKKLRHFSSLSGGLVCDECIKSVKDSIYVNDNTIKAIKYLAKVKFKNLENIQISKNTLYALDKIIADYIRIHLDIDLKYKHFLDNIKNLKEV